jgi:SAM-dependent methyltransferase
VAAINSLQFARADDVFALPRALARRGGPAEDEYPLFDAWLMDTAERVRAGILSASEVHRFWLSLGEPYLSESMAGRSLSKPFGYPGDFALIDDVYRGTISENPELVLWDRYLQAQPAPRAVRNRIAYFASRVDEAARRRADARVLVLGCGPGRDVWSYFRSRPDTAVRFLALDRDPRALDYARALCDEQASAIQFAAVDVLRYRTTRAFDLIWAAGLFDYFSDRLFARVLRRYAAFLRPGGELIIGNFSTANPSRAYMELCADWALRHRSSSTLADIARAAGFSSFRVGAETEGINLFLHVERDA